MELKKIIAVSCDNLFLCHNIEKLERYFRWSNLFCTANIKVFEKQITVDMMDF